MGVGSDTIEQAPGSADPSVPPGYTRTEVGVIPEDWEIKAVQQLGQITTGPFGTLLKASEYAGAEGVPLISVGEIGANRFIVTDETPLVPERVQKRLPQYLLRAGDIVFGRKGAVDRSALVRDTQAGWFLGSDGISIRPIESCNPEYLAWQFQSAVVQAWLLQNATGTTMATLNQELLRRVKIPYAPSREQTKIVQALSDVDGLIGALEALIAKKRAIKQAAMQQLLTAKTRLPGFTAEWQTVNMASDSLLKARIGWQGLTTAEYRETGDYYLVTGTDFDAGQVDWSRCHFVDEHRYRQDRNIQLVEGDVLLTKDGTIGKAGYVVALPGPATLNSGVFVIRPRNEAYLPRYMYYVLTSRIFNDFLARLQAGSTISHLYQKDFVGFNFEAPPKQEQETIVAVLSDMDAEIAALKQRRNKARDIRQGMMQQLLTGRIRLVEPKRESEAKC